MTTYAFPSVTPNTSSCELVSNTKTFRSPVSNAVQTVGRKGSLWAVSMQFKNLTGADRAELQGFLAKLNGQEHRFTLHDHSYVRRGTGGGTLRVNGASQTGSTLVCDGATFSVTSYLLTGDYLSFNNELHMITSDASSDGAGNVTLSIAPPIRKPTINNNLVDIAVPVLGVFMLASKASWDNRPGQSVLSTFAIDAVEDVLA